MKLVKTHIFQTYTGISPITNKKECYYISVIIKDNKPMLYACKVDQNGTEEENELELESRLQDALNDIKQYAHNTPEESS